MLVKLKVCMYNYEYYCIYEYISYAHTIHLYSIYYTYAAYTHIICIYICIPNYTVYLLYYTLYYAICNTIYILTLYYTYTKLYTIQVSSSTACLTRSIAAPQTSHPKTVCCQVYRYSIFVHMQVLQSKHINIILCHLMH